MRYLWCCMDEQSKLRTTIGLTIGVFLAAMEGTVVATAMPNVIMDLGGEHLYSLPFSMYLLTMTVSSPLWGKFSDIFGRRRIYAIGVLIFLIGSAGCGFSQSMEFLITMRIIQGIGAGSMSPLTFTINADMYSIEKRAKMQGYMSGVWGFSGLVGPLLGGFIVDWLDWRYIFYLNIPFGIFALFMVYFNYRDSIERTTFRLNWPGVILFTLGAGSLVIGLENMNYIWIAAGCIGMAVSWMLDSRHPNPLLPVGSLKLKIPRTAIIQNVLAGMGYFGILAFLPLYVQRVEDRGATTAGLVLTPMIVGWTITSIIGGRLLPRVGLLTLTRMGFSLLVLGFLSFFIFYDNTILFLSMAGLTVGAGMGFSMLGTLLLTQEYSPKNELGSSTSSIMFGRTIGGSIGVSILSAIISDHLTSSLPILQSAFRSAYLACLIFAILAFSISFTIHPPSPKNQT